MHRRPMVAFVVVGTKIMRPTDKDARGHGRLGREREPPLTYLTRWRMITAARLLRADRTPLASVARHVGYTSEFAFAKAFKREYGIAPGAYRREHSG